MKYIVFHSDKEEIWLRIGDWVLSFRNFKKTGLMFSERGGYTNFWKIGNTIIKIENMKIIGRL